MEIQKRIILLIGPKGSGKTHLASLAAENLDVHCIPADSIWLRIDDERELSGEEYTKARLSRVYAAINAEFLQTSSVILESTGTASWFNEFLSRLKSFGEVILIKVDAPEDVCLQRIRRQSQLEGIEVPEEQIKRINQISRNLEMNWDASFNNNDDESNEKQFIDMLKNILSISQ